MLYRVLQGFGVLALFACLALAWGGTPWGGEGWSRAKLLYAGAGAVSALALIAIGALGLAQRRAEVRLGEIQAELQAVLRRLPPA